MNSRQIYLAIAIIVLALIALLVSFINRNKSGRQLTPLAGLAFGFILAGIIFGDERLVGYSLMGIGVILAIIDIIKKLRANKDSEFTPQNKV